MDEAHAERRQSSAVSRSNSASAAAAHAVSTSSSGSSSSPAQPSSPLLARAAARDRADARHHDERPVARRPPRPGPCATCPRARPGGGSRSGSATRPAGAVRSVETSRSAYSTWPSVRGMGVAVISRTCGWRPGPPSPRARHAAPRRSGAARPRRRARGPRTRRSPGGARACPRRPAPARSRSPRSALRRPFAVERAGQQRDGDAEVLEQRRDGREVLAGEQVRRGEHRRLAARRAPPPRAPTPPPRSCPSPTSPWTSRSIGVGRAEVVADLGDGLHLVGRERDRVAQLARERGLERVADGRVAPPRPPRSAQRGPARATAGAPPCPTGAPAARRTRGGGARRPGPRSRAGSGPPRAPPRSTGGRLAPQPRRQVLGVGAAVAVEGLAHRRRGAAPPSPRPSAGRRARSARRGAATTASAGWKSGPRRRSRSRAA